MESTDMYKEFYFFEINRKHELNNAVNVPVIVLSIIVSIHFFFFSQKMNCCVFLVGKIVSCITALGMIYSIYFLIRSFSNFIKNYHYREISDMKTVYEYELKLNQKDKDDNEFNDYLKEEFAHCASHNFEINKNRTEDLAKSKKGIFICLITTFLFSIVYIISIF
jgi:hypothetical protein